MSDVHLSDVHLGYYFIKSIILMNILVIDET